MEGSFPLPWCTLAQVVRWCVGESSGGLIQLGQDFRAITGRVHLEVDTEMIRVQEISWGVVSGTMLVEERREQDWAEGGIGL